MSKFWQRIAWKYLHKDPHEPYTAEGSPSWKSGDKPRWRIDEIGEPVWGGNWTPHDLFGEYGHYTDQATDDLIETIRLADKQRKKDPQ